MRSVTIYTSAVVLLALTACSSSDKPADNQPNSDATTAGATTDGSATDGSATDGTSPDPTSGNTDWGIVEVDSDEEVDLVGIFGRFPTGITPAEFLEELLPEVDTCVVTSGGAVNSDDEDDDVIPEFSQGYEFISAGESLTFSSAAGTYATLPKILDGETTGYTLNDNGPDLPGPAPDNLILDIPGDQFPAAANLSFPDAEPIDVTLSTGFFISKDTIFTWTPGASPNSIVDIYATSFAGSSESRVECVLEDDGEFEFPEAAKELIFENFTSNFPSYARTVYTVQEIGSSTLVLVNTVEN